jgi:DNA repair exonuclease SbcCD nuclease subunit
MRFLHTSDWQLGMTRHYLGAEAQGRFSQARIDVVRTLARVAQERSCAFVVVAGDVFETNQPNPRTIGRVGEALAAFTVPVYLLPGNHDPYDPGSVYRSDAFRAACPPHVEVLTDTDPRVPVPGVEVVGVPWTSKWPDGDLVTRTVRALPAAEGVRRVVVGHGSIAEVSGRYSTPTPGAISLGDLRAALADGAAHYVALGDRHSTLPVDGAVGVGGDGGTGARIWFSGAPEPTSHREDDAGNALVVDLQQDPPAVEPVAVGSWRFLDVDADLHDDADLDDLVARLDAVEDKACTVVRVKVAGIVTLHQAARLDRELDARAEVFGALQRPERHTDLTVAPVPEDLDDLPVHGYARTAVDRLRRETDAPDPDDARVATDALALLVRLLDTEVAR